MKLKTFRGKLANGGQDTIRLSNNNGLMGYQIKKLQLMPSIPGDTTDVEYVVKVYSVKRTTVPTGAGGDKAEVNLSDQTLLAVAYYQDNVSVSSNSSLDIVIDNMKVNQNIFVTCTNNTGSGGADCNYYMELEQVKLSKDEAAVATLKDMRGRE
tara:strand:+ start:34 stop:495 length:462 start_codon:yes stop_codon:yes gene_type:complete